MRDQEVNEIDEYVESYKHKRKLLVEKRKKISEVPENDTIIQGVPKWHANIEVFKHSFSYLF